MHSVFSNYLEPLIEARIVLTEPKKPSDIYNRLRIIYNQGVKGILNNTRLMVLSSDGDVDYDLLYEIWRNEHLSKLTQWINENITLSLGIDNYITINVKLRIATGMLNNLVNKGLVSSISAIQYHDRLVSNVRNEVSILLTEDLPF